MERVPELLKSKIMSADQAAQLIRTGMTIGVSGFTSVGYPKAVPEALVRSGHARDLTICVGAAVGDEIDGAMVRAGLVKKRYAHQSHKDLRNAINAGTVGYSDVHISHFPMHMNQHTGPKIDVAVVECTAVSEQGLYLAASGGSADAAVRNADKVIVEVNETLPEGLVGMHDIFEIGLPPHARIIPITKPDDRVGTPYIPCPPEKIAAIVLTDRRDEPQKFKPYSEATRTIGVNVVKFLKQEIAAGRLPENPGPIQSGVGSVGNAVLSCLASSGFHGLSMYTEVMQDSALNLIEQGVFDFVSTSSIALGEENRRRFYENIDFFKDKILLRPQEITNHPEVVRRLGVISLNTPIEVDIYGNVNSTHIMGTKMMNGIGGSGDFARNARVCISRRSPLPRAVSSPASCRWCRMWTRPSMMCRSSSLSRASPICAGRRRASVPSSSLKTVHTRITGPCCVNITSTRSTLRTESRRRTIWPRRCPGTSGFWPPAP